MAGRALTILGSLLTWVVCMASAASVRTSDPERDFVETPDSVLVNYGMLRSDRLLRLDLDLFGNGTPTIFLAFDAGGSRIGSTWSAYTPVEGGFYQRVDGIQFRPDTYRAGKLEGLTDNGGLLVYYPGKGGGNLVRYEINGEQASNEQLRALDFSKPEDRHLFQTVFGRAPDDPLPPSYLSNPPYKILSAAAIRGEVVKQIQTEPSASGTAKPQVVEMPVASPIASDPTATASATQSKPTSSRFILFLLSIIGVAMVILLGFALRKRR